MMIFERKRISGGTELLMGAVAWCVAGVNFLINIILDWFGIGEILSPIFMILSYCGFAFWFGLHGISVIKGKMVKEFALNFLLSITPVVNVFAFKRTKNGLLEPNIRHMVRRVIEITREEDAKYNQEQVAKNTPKRDPDNVIRHDFRPPPTKDLRKAA